MPTTVILNDGNQMPTMAYGTGSAMKGHDVTRYVEQALEAGFSHIDTAKHYANEESIGLAIRESGFQRDELFVTTKYDGGDIQKAIRESLTKLGLKWVDLYLIHFPGFVEPDMEGAWKEFEKIKEDGLAKSIGVSNFNVEQLQRLMKAACIKPAVNQIEFHPYCYATQRSTVEYCAKHGIVIEGYSGLKSLTRLPGGPVDPVVRTIATRLNATAAQVLLAWVRAKGAVVVTTSSKKDRLLEYLAVEDLSPLTPEEIHSIDHAGSLGPPSFYLLPQTLTAIPLSVSNLPIWARVIIAFIMMLAGLALHML